jgi:hypothetical protein
MRIWSRHRAVFVGLFLVGACASSPHDASQTPASDSSEPSSSAVADVASNDAPAATAAEASPYPEDAIRRGQTDAEKHCTNLAYKSGCGEGKSGDLTIRITVRDDGSVLAIHRVKNAIKNDSQAVEACVFDAVQSFHFDAPGSAASSFTMKIAFDKC